MYIIKSLIIELYELSMPDRARFGLQKTKTILEMRDWVKYDGIYVGKGTAVALKARAGKIKDYNIYFVICNVIYGNVENMVKKEIRSTYNKKHYNNGGKERQAFFYKNTEKGRASQRKSARNYSKTEKGRASQRKGMRKYIKTVKGKKAMKKALSKSYAKRQRDLGWIPLINNNPFPCKVDWHHINNLLVIPIPDITHRNTLGMSHRERCGVWINKLFGFIGVNNE